MAQYLVLIYEAEGHWEQGGPETAQALKEHQALRSVSAVQSGAWLHPTGTATSIRKDASGEFAVTDGPFVETKEALGGYYLIEAADLDEAIAVAKQVPAPFGGLEVRPIRPPSA